MHFEEFNRVVTCFADRVDDVATSAGELLVQIRDETIAAKLSNRPDGLMVEENGDRMPAERWIVTRLARVPLLADRILSHVRLPEYFVQTSGSLVDQPDQDASADGTTVPDVSRAATQNLDRRPGGTTLASDREHGFSIRLPATNRSRSPICRWIAGIVKPSPNTRQNEMWRIHRAYSTRSHVVSAKSIPY